MLRSSTGKPSNRLSPVASCRVAEAVKLTENIFRAVNIAMVNELKLVFESMGIDIWDVIAAAKTKPFGFMPFYPGPGVGGHCIPVDPFYLTWKARQYGQETRFIELAGKINTAMPAHVVRRVATALASSRKKLKGSRVLLLGIAYKANVDDDRESPAYAIWNLLEAAGAKVNFHDPHISVIRPSREHAHLAGRHSLALTARIISAANVVLVVTMPRRGGLFDGRQTRPFDCGYPQFISTGPIRANGELFQSVAWMMRALRMPKPRSVSGSPRRFYQTSSLKFFHCVLPPTAVPWAPCQNNATIAPLSAGGLQFPLRRLTPVSKPRPVVRTGSFRCTFTFVTNCGNRVQHFASLERDVFRSRMMRRIL